MPDFCLSFIVWTILCKYVQGPSWQTGFLTHIEIDYAILLKLLILWGTEIKGLNSDAK